MSSFYNEFNPYAADWLECLIAAGHIPDGVVDRRSITEIEPHELEKYTQCHFFAGIGGWPLALRMAGWPDDAGVWTGSPPCQPYSSAGKNLRQSDERHLSPVFTRLISKSKPPIIFGEQVAAAIAAGWLDDLFFDMEKTGYACASAVLRSAPFAGCHERARLYFTAHRDSEGLPVGFSLGQPCVFETNEPHRRRELGRILATENWRQWEAESGFHLLADGVPARVGKISAFGNAIDPEVAKNFIIATVEAIQEKNRLTLPA